MTDDLINNALAALLPSGAAGTVTPDRARHVLAQLAAAVREDAENSVLTSLLTINDVAETLGISARRAKALARNRHERFGVGWQVPGTGQWLFRPEELEALRPDARYRRRI